MGKYINPAISNSLGLIDASKALKNAEIKVKSFEQTNANSGDLVFFDPPYCHIGKTSNFTSYTPQSFTEVDQVRLRDLMLDLSNKGVKVIQSNSDCSFIKNLYSDFKIYEIQASRALNCKTDKNKKSSQLIWELFLSINQNRGFLHQGFLLPQTLDTHNTVK